MGEGRVLACIVMTKSLPGIKGLTFSYLLLPLTDFQ